MSSGPELTVCGACGGQTPAGKRFCIHCGTEASVRCPACGESAVPGARFCAECGTALQATAPAPAGTPTSPPVAERRLVSVLFADLVGFTGLSEHRDPEEVRELLSRYFDRCRVIIERYGGTVEKFIGDAVMAVWGSPVAREDDAERAVRAALSLTGSVTLLGEEEGVPELRVRAGVLTGSAAVEVGLEGEGMVLGDTVNTAARLQSIAAAGTVLVDDVTRRASEAAIEYEDAGAHEVKGREAPVHAWTALRVVAGAGGARRSVGLEAPFVGRERELAEIIEAGEESARDGRARHVAVIGEAGSGKSRLLWEFFKYLDGIEEVRYWHQGRCLSYGDGVAYWALAEMVRARAGIHEEEDPVAARGKLRAAVERHVPDERERRLVEPRLAHLLRLDERADADRADLFSGWRLFFERLAATQPVVLAFEDLQWADSGLLDFVDYLLEWSADHPIFVLSLARPELRDRRPGWTVMTLEPLAPQAITAILEGMAPGLPEDLVGEIGRRAEGIPLYAVETIRMLQDRGALVQEGARYRLTGEIGDLEVPETLHALVASRLDGLSARERSLVQNVSVLGQSFTAAAAAAVSEQPESEVAPVLDALVAKQVLARDTDARSPERGQYVFLQALLRTVAYGTLARRVRKARHLSAARYLEQAPGELRDIAEVLASHYMEAIGAEPDAPDVGTLRAAARETLAAAGQAAASLALGPEAERYLDQAAELTDDDIDRARLYEQAGRALTLSGDVGGAERRLRMAIEHYERAGSLAGAPASARLAEILSQRGRLDEARALLEAFRSPGEAGVDDVVRAEALSGLGRLMTFAGELHDGAQVLEEAMGTLEREQAWPALADGLINRAVLLLYTHRREESRGALRHALTLAQEHRLPSVALRAGFNLAALAIEADRFEEALGQLQESLVLARERGDRRSERQLQGQMVAPLVLLGRWDEAVALGTVLLSGEADLDAMTAAAFLSGVAAARGDESMLALCQSLAEQVGDSDYVDERMCASLVRSRGRLQDGDHGNALRLASRLLGEQATGGEFIEQAYALSIEAAMTGPRTATLSELETFVSELPRARASPLLRAGRARLAAEREHRAGHDDNAALHEGEAISLLREVQARPLLAAALLERCARREDPEALAEARAILEELGATRWLARLDQDHPGAARAGDVPLSAVE